MTVKLSIEMTSPLSADDHDLMSGIAVMTLAIADHELAARGFPETFLRKIGPRRCRPPRAGPSTPPAARSRADGRGTRACATAQSGRRATAAGRTA
jgi:hypothetical protein